MTVSERDIDLAIAGWNAVHSCASPHLIVNRSEREQMRGALAATRVTPSQAQVQAMAQALAERLGSLWWEDMTEDARHAWTQAVSDVIGTAVAVPPPSRIQPPPPWTTNTTFQVFRDQDWLAQCAAAGIEVQSPVE